MRPLVSLSLLVILAACGDDGSASLDAGRGDAGLGEAGLGDGSVADATTGRDAGPRDVDAGPPPEDLDGFVEWQMARGGLPGLATALIVDGEVVHEGLYGYADVEADRAVDAHTLFAVASVSKLFTGIVALRAWEEGRLDLDADVGETLGFALRHPDHPAAPITARMLLTHTSGLRDNWPMLGQTTYEGDPEIDLETFTRGYALEGGEWFAGPNWGAAPGTAHDYCNAAFAVAAHLSEAAWGEGFRAASERLAFEPLGFEDTGWWLADVDAGKLAVPYTWNAARGSFVPLEQTTPAHYPAGGLRASLHDLERWARAMLRGGELDGVRVLEAETVEAMRTLQVPDLSTRQGLVMRYDGIGGHGYVGHSGAGIGGSANVLLRTDTDAALIVLSNGDAYIRARLGFTEGRDAMDAILERLDTELEAELEAALTAEP